MSVSEENFESQIKVETKNVLPFYSLLRVRYLTSFDWCAVPWLADDLATLHLEASESGMNDKLLEGMLRQQQGTLRSLQVKAGEIAYNFATRSWSNFHSQELLILGQAHGLTGHSLSLLAAECPRLRWVGDLRNWGLTKQERRELAVSEGWGVEKREPVLRGADSVDIAAGSEW